MKKYLFVFLSLFALSFVTASFTMHNWTLSADVDEPFTVGWSVNPGMIYDEFTGTWIDDPLYDGCYSGDGYDYGFNGGSASFEELQFPGDSKTMCVSIENDAESNLSYTILATPTIECEGVFSEQEITGIVNGETTSFEEITISIEDDAEPVTGCEIDLSVLRG